LIRKIHEAKAANDETVVLWGSGTPKREFLYVDDLAKAVVFLASLDNEHYADLTNPAQCPLINIGTGEDQSIRKLAEIIAEVVGYNGKFIQDTSKPDGTMRKVLDVSRINQLGWKASTSLKEGINLTYKDFENNISSDGVYTPSLQGTVVV
jgi:GDP-L-fucose synthase